MAAISIGTDVGDAWESVIALRLKEAADARGANSQNTYIIGLIAIIKEQLQEIEQELQTS